MSIIRKKKLTKQNWSLENYKLKKNKVILINLIYKIKRNKLNK